MSKSATVLMERVAIWVALGRVRTSGRTVLPSIIAVDWSVNALGVVAGWLVLVDSMQKRGQESSGMGQSGWFCLLQILRGGFNIAQIEYLLFHFVSKLQKGGSLFEEPPKSTDSTSRLVACLVMLQTPLWSPRLPALITPQSHGLDPRSRGSALFVLSWQRGKHTKAAQGRKPVA